MKLSENLNENGVTVILSLVGTLGLAETTEAKELRARIVELIVNSSSILEVHDLYGKYEVLIEAIVEQNVGIEAQIGAQLLKAAIFREGGVEDMCDGFLYDAIVCAANAGLDAVADQIRALRIQA